MNMKKEILDQLEASGAMMKESYLHQELLDESKAFEREMLKVVFQDRYSDRLRTYDLVAHLKSRAEQYELTDNQVYDCLIRDLEHFSHEMGSMVNGARGEQYANWSLKRLTVNNEALSNLQLCFDGEEAEYDNIIITAQGIFIIEVKFFTSPVVIGSDGMLRGKFKRIPGTYNVGEKIQSKEYVLWKTLEPFVGNFLSRNQIHSVVLNANNNQRIDDDFGFVPVKSCGSVNYYIRDFGSEVLSDEEVRAIKEALLDSAAVIKHAPSLDFKRIRNNFAEVLELFEEAANRTEIKEDCPCTEASLEDGCPEHGLPRWARNTLGVLGGIAVTGATAFGISRIPQVRVLVRA